MVMGVVQGKEGEADTAKAVVAAAVVGVLEEERAAARVVVARVAGRVVVVEAVLGEAKAAVVEAVTLEETVAEAARSQL